MTTHAGRQWSARSAADECFRRAAAPTTTPSHALVWKAAGEHLRNSAEDEAAGRWGAATLRREEAFAALTVAGLALGDAPTHPSITSAPAPEPENGADTEAHRRLRMVGTCALRAQTLRHAAERAPVMQAERGVVQFGAAAALERAAALWSRADDGGASAWMRAAEAVLDQALIPVPWKRD